MRRSTSHIDAECSNGGQISSTSRRMSVELPRNNIGSRQVVDDFLDLQPASFAAIVAFAHQTSSSSAVFVFGKR